MSGGSDPAQKRRIVPFVGPDLLPRILSAIVLVPLTGLALIVGEVFFAILIGLTMAGAYWEWEAMITSKRLPFPAVLLMGFLALGAVGFAMAGIWAILIVFALALVCAAVVPGPHTAWRMGGLIYFAAVIIALLGIRGDVIAGVWAGLFLLAIVWSTDSGAYFVGRMVGGIKLSPDVSPSKTWSGALGGLVFGMLGGLVVWLLAGWVLDTRSPWVIGALISVVLSIAGQGGDLFESALKRRFMIKDSGDIIPGHGGLMDRLDSLTVAGLVLWLIGLAHRGIGAVPQGILVWGQ